MRNARTVMVLAVSFAVIYMASGCATLQRGPSDEELLADLLSTYGTSLQEADVDKLIGLYSKDYVSPEGGDYEETVSFLRQVVPSLEGYNLEISTTDARIEIEGKTATIGPISFDADWGEMQITLFATKEADGCWRITSSEMES